ncbi:alpha-hemolysin, partial [Clostridium botulinum]
KTAILKVAPINSIETIDVSETMGYSVGGSIEVTGSSTGGSGGSSGNANYSVSKTISYKQPDYQTILKTNDSLDVLWNITYNRNKEGYDRDSWNTLYGNQLFMRSRNSNTGIENLTLNNDLSSLITGGFSPKGIIAIKTGREHISGTSNTDLLTVKLTRIMDKYDLIWATSHWKGINTKDYTNKFLSSSIWIDWTNYRLS